MPVAPGTRIGSYEVTSLLGKGGMGELYRAKDTKLGRDVAIKTLPTAFATSPDRLMRFEREAKVLAKLSHPNIATIYALDDYDEGKALVMELVEGSTIDGPLPVEQAAKVAAQVADALEAAHDKGITHRDIKPGNIMVTPQGAVKVLDFGLAAVPQAEPEESTDGATAITLTFSPTQAGMILGTAPYMSPEQAAGLPVDRHADIWSFGVLLWEMLTGSRLFTGDTVAHVLADVLRGPIDFSKLPPETPKPIRELLARCLERDLRKRLHAIGEARLILEKWIADPSSGQPQAVLPPVANAQPIRTWKLAAAGLGVAALALGAVAVLHFREKPVEQHAVASTLLPPPGGEFELDFPFYALPAISPDGTRMVYGAKLKNGPTQLWLRRLDSTTAQPMPGTDNPAMPFWSADSRWVAFGQDKKLKKIDTQGGPPVAVADMDGTLRGGTWNSDGVILFSTKTPESSIQRVSAAGGVAQPITAPVNTELKASGVERYKAPWFLPDGRHFLYVGSKTGDEPVYVGSIEEPSKPGKLVAQAGSPAVYSQGHLLYLRESTLMAQPFDTSRLATTSEPVPIAENVPTFTDPTRFAGFAVSASGILAYQSDLGFETTRLVWRDRQGKELGTLGGSDIHLGSVALSRDGKFAAVSFNLAHVHEDLGIYEVARGIRSRFTFGAATEREPIWSPDGSSIFFAANPAGRYDLYRKASNGTGAEEVVLADATSKAPYDVSPDGKWLLFGSGGLKLLPLAPGGGKPEPRDFVAVASRGKFSPDGQWIVYVSSESGTSQIYAAPFPGPGGKRQISPNGGIGPRWRRDGKEIFYINAEDGQLLATEVSLRGATLDIGREQKLPITVIQTRGMLYDVSPDGQKFLVAEDGAGTASPLTLVQNWTALLRK